MSKILKAVIAVAVVYLAVTEGWPWLKSRLDGAWRRSGASDQEICYDATRRAADDFAERLRRFSLPPIDAEAWEETVSESRARIDAADRQCRNCDHEACLETARALSDLEGMLTWFDESVQAGRGIPPDGASRFDAVYDGLSRAQPLL